MDTLSESFVINLLDKHLYSHCYSPPPIIPAYTPSGFKTGFCVRLPGGVQRAAVQ